MRPSLPARRLSAFLSNFHVLDAQTRRFPMARARLIFFVLGLIFFVGPWANRKISALPSGGTYFLEVQSSYLGNGIPAACQHRPNRCCFPAVCDLETPKARKTFHKKSESESALLGMPPPPGYLCGPYFKLIARTDHGNPAFRDIKAHAAWARAQEWPRC